MKGINGYKHLVTYLSEIGHYQERYPAACREEPADARAVVGLEIYRLLSSRSPEEIRISADKIFRPCAEKADLSQGVSNEEVEDILREDIVLKILGCRPQNYSTAYKKDDGHLRLDDFSNCFNGSDSKYTDWIAQLKSRAGAHRLIEQDEQNRVNQAVNRNKEKLKQLICLLKSEPAPLPELGARLEENLQEYGFKPGNNVDK